MKVVKWKEFIHTQCQDNPDKKLIFNFFVNPEDKKFISNEFFGFIYRLLSTFETNRLKACFKACGLKALNSIYTHNPQTKT